MNSTTYLMLGLSGSGSTRQPRALHGVGVKKLDEWGDMTEGSAWVSSIMGRRADSGPSLILLSLIGHLDANDRERAFLSFRTRTCCPCRARTASFQRVVQLVPVLQDPRGWTSMCEREEEQWWENLRQGANCLALLQSRLISISKRWGKCPWPS